MWNRGHIKLTGTIRNLRSFVTTRLVALDRHGILLSNAWESVVDKDGCFWTRNVSPVECFLVGSHKFIITTDDIAARGKSEDAVDTINLPFRKPGDIHAPDFLAMAKRFGLDINIYLGNYDQEVYHRVDIKDGEIITDYSGEMGFHQPRIIMRETYA